MPKKILLLALALYLVSAVGSYSILRAVGKSTTTMSESETETTVTEGKNELALLNINAKDPKDQPCPLNGKLYTKLEQSAWEKRRPLYVMIENTPDARPQSGLSDADVVFEAVAEGGITRFGAMFYCEVQAVDTTLAPIRSARTYYVNWASGFNRPLYVHVGGANIPGPLDALGQLNEYGWAGQNDFNQFSIGYPTFVRDANRLAGKNVATEHTMVTSTEKLWKVADKRKWTNMSPDATLRGKKVAGTDWKAGYKGWATQDGQAGKGTVNKISYEFWSGYDDYAVSWDYDTTTNSYQRTQGGEAHVDLNDTNRVAAKNVVILFTIEKGPVDEAKHMSYATEGTGQALIFHNGEAVKGSWSKKSRESELEFFDSKGSPINFVKGMIWISTLAKNTAVTY